MTANIMGRSNARRGARRIFAVLQNRRLNQHIVYTVLDEVSRPLVDDSAFIDKFCRFIKLCFLKQSPKLLHLIHEDTLRQDWHSYSY